MFTTALFTITEIRKQPQCLPVDERINKMSFIHTMEYYSALKKNEMRPFETTWMNLEDIVLNEISQAEKDRCCMIPLIWDI